MLTEWTTPFVANKDEFIKRVTFLDEVSYESLLRTAVRLIWDIEVGGDQWSDTYPDPTRIHTVDDGSYQGTLVFVLGALGYQPSTYWYTMVSYGSCSGCDALQDAVGWSTENNYEALYSITLHMLQRAKRMEEE